MLDIEAILQQFELIEQKVEHVVQARKQLQKRKRRSEQPTCSTRKPDYGKNRGRKET
jgi:hypothetical protein